MCSIDAFETARGSEDDTWLSTDPYAVLLIVILIDSKLTSKT